MDKEYIEKEKVLKLIESSMAWNWGYNTLYDEVGNLERATGPECKWCEIFRKNKGWSVYVGDGRYEHVKYKFCPVCGRMID